MKKIQDSIKNILTQTAAFSFLLVVLGWIILGAANESDPFKSSISLFGSYFGGITTLIAAYIASQLFNDWKEQHNKTIISGDARNAFSAIHDERNILHDLSAILSKTFEENTYNPLISDHSAFSEKFKALITLLDGNRLKLAEFVLLIEDSDLHNKITAYRRSISDLEIKINDWSENGLKIRDVCKDYISHIGMIKTLNNNILSELKTYILYKNEALL